MTLVDAARVAAIALGGLSVVGGAIGYAKAKSRASLIAGGASGVLLLSSAWWMGNAPTGGLILAAVVGVGLLGKFGVGAVRKPTPVAAVMTLGSLAVIGLAAGALLAGG